MKRSMIAFGILTSSVLAGCMVGDTGPSLSSDEYLEFDEFKSLTYKEPCGIL